MQPTFSFWDIIHLVVVAQGLFIGCLFCISRIGNRITNLFLGLLLIAFSFRLFEITAFWTKLDLSIPHILETSFPLSYLFGVFIYFYVKHLTSNGRKTDKYLWLHFIPFIIITISLFPFYFSSAASKVDILLHYFNTGNFKNIYMTTWKVFLQFPHILIYIVLSLLVLNKKIRSLHENDQSLGKKLIRIKYLIIGFVSCYFLWMLSFTGVFNGVVDMRMYDYISISGMIVFIYTIGYLSFTIPDVHVSIHKVVKNKYSNSTLTKEQSAQNFKRLKELMEIDKLYLKQDLSLIDLSKLIEISPNLISQIINEELGHNFFEFVNQYRVDEAKRLLANGESKRYTIASIAYDSGFNNKTSFNNYFKKITGSTPSEYRNTTLKSTREY